MKKLVIFILTFSLLAAFGCSKSVVKPKDGVTESDTALPETTSEESTTEESTAVDTTAPNTTPAETTTPNTTAPEQTTQPPETTKTEDPNPKYYKVTNFDDVKAIWLSQFDLTSVYVDKGKQREQSAFKTLMGSVLDNAKASGFNTVFLQIRPNADSFYPSEYYPPSRYVLGAYGREFDYDPIKVTVELAKEKGLSVHAWINPLRAMSNSELKSVQEKYSIKKWSLSDEYNGKYVVRIANAWYLNPAYQDVRDLIINGAVEAVSKYELDGLHMDDYFYPTTSSDFDEIAYSEYKNSGGELGLADWRRDNLNKLIKGLYDATKNVNPDALYGISPAGNWNTVYNTQYADYVTWCSVPGYIDYICPQVYFGLEHQTFDFVKTSTTWHGFIKTDSVKLIIGMTLGKAFSGGDQWAGTGKYEWTEHKDVIKRCIEATLELEKCTGVSVFCYQYLYDPTSGKAVNETLEEKNNFLPTLISASWKN